MPIDEKPNFDDVQVIKIEVTSNRVNEPVITAWMCMRQARHWFTTTNEAAALDRARYLAIREGVACFLSDDYGVRRLEHHDAPSARPDADPDPDP